jgi:hypothetical protein
LEFGEGPGLPICGVEVLQQVVCTDRHEVDVFSDAVDCERCGRDLVVGFPF